MSFLTSVGKKIPAFIALSMFAATCYWLIYSMANASNLVYASMTDEFINLGLLDDPYAISLIVFGVVNLVLLIGFLFNTRVKLFEKPLLRKSHFIILWSAVVISYAWLLFKGMHTHVFPYVETLLAQTTIEEDSFLSSLVNEQSSANVLMMVFPLCATFILMMTGVNTYNQYRDSIQQAFKEFRWQGGWLQIIDMIEKNNDLPDVKLGKNSETNEYVTQPGKDRTLNNLIVGSIGTGKSAALALPLINQDLHHMTSFINQYPKLAERDDYHSEEVKGSYLNGISIIEPSNGLCEKAYQLCKAHGIPDEAITYLDPTNPNTPNFNPMKGPVDKVAEGLAQVIDGLNESGDSNFYFEQAQRNHLKQYVYLLKLHDETEEVTFDMFLDMYNNPQVARMMHEKLKKRFPDDIESITDRDEYNEWKIIQQVDEWFDQNLIPETQHIGGGQKDTVKIKSGEFRGMEKYYDAKAEHVQGLRNVLNDIGANKLIRRVLFGKSDFDFDTHLEMGGVLLCNTAKGDLLNLSNVFGKMVLLSLQNAVFRREPDVSTYHHIMVDEAPDYLYQPFREFPAQSRKYKTIISVVCQTISQMADRYGEHYLTTLVGTLRHRMVYGDIPGFDAEYFSKLFSDTERYEESGGEQVVSPLQENPMVRQTANYQKVKEARMSPSDIMYQDAFQCAVKIVSNNKPIPVQQIDANFVPKKEFKRSRYRTKDKPLQLWLTSRQTFGQDHETEIINDTEETLKDVEDMQRTDETIESTEQSHTLELDYDDLPKPTTQYKSSSYNAVPLSQPFHELDTEKSEPSTQSDDSAVEGNDTLRQPQPSESTVEQIEDEPIPLASIPGRAEVEDEQTEELPTEEPKQPEKTEPNFKTSKLSKEAAALVEELKE